MVNMYLQIDLPTKYTNIVDTKNYITQTRNTDYFHAFEETIAIIISSLAKFCMIQRNLSSVYLFCITKSHALDLALIYLFAVFFLINLIFYLFYIFKMPLKW